MNSHTRINFWSSPRNISTALMYSFAQRADTQVVDEPLYAHYLKHGQPAVLHPGEREVLQTQENDGNKVVSEILFGSYDRPVVLFKQMTHHLVELDWDFMRSMRNVILIRDPRYIISSYTKIIPNPSIEDIGVEKQLELFHYLEEHNCLSAIVDARELLLNPAFVLRELCARLDLPFDPAMLQWEAGAREEDGIWAPYWYKTVHKSTGFRKYLAREFNLQGIQQALAEQCMPYYQKLYEYALKAN